MSRVIKPDSTGKQRTQLSKAIVLAVRELARQDGVTDQTRDLAAFIAIALQIIADGIDASVTAWEKRDYWIKADRFRLEWAWAGQISEKMRISVLADDWGTVATLSAQVAQKLAKVQVSENHRLGRPWVGAYQELIRNKTT
ncbi:MAG TPA: hypothetical protein VLX61_17430 [Anaerolineales bacterium]|nr:hypothetical protein [Anaerolineales bacterium]